LKTVSRDKATYSGLADRTQRRTSRKGPITLIRRPCHTQCSASAPGFSNEILVRDEYGDMLKHIGGRQNTRRVNSTGSLRRLRPTDYTLLTTCPRLLHLACSPRLEGEWAWIQMVMVVLLFILASLPNPTRHASCRTDIALTLPVLRLARAGKHSRRE